MVSTKNTDETLLSFEDAMRELEQIVQKLETGNTPLEDSISLYERGAKLRDVCEMRLKKAQLRIEKIVSVEDGMAKTESVNFE